jgi:glycosyltransferase involved in cell wall biosynthesis
MVQHNPIFSVIVPVYNKGPYISRSINSILNQTFQSFELIIVCDPSTDNSLDEIEKFTDPRISVYHRNEPGPGGYAARNLGIANAKGEWVAFLDADDEYYSDNLEKSYSIINANPDIGLITSARHAEQDSITVLDGFSSNQLNDSKRFSFSDYISECLNNRRAFGTNSVMLKKSFFKGSSYFPAG